MSKYVIDSSTLTSIADAVRAKTGKTDPIVVSDIPTEISKISSGDDLPAEAFVITGDCQYRFANLGWDWFIEKYGDRVTTKDISDASDMFKISKTKYIPFDINFEDTNSYTNSSNMFNNSYNLREAPVLNNLHVYSTSQMFLNCSRLRTVPENFADTWDWSYLEKQTTSYTGSQDSMFKECYSLRSFPMSIFKSGNPYLGYSSSYFYYGFYACCVLNELVNLPIPYTKAKWTSNAFNRTFIACARLKNITFALNNGVPYAVTWKSQVIDLTTEVGFSNDSNPALSGWNNGITADKEVKDDATYQALKNDPDWFTMDINYSRYNHDSAVRTINSLPDTSAYLASAGGTNTIKFTGASGTNTDGGAINTLTSEEIAVATAKGWTVTFA